MGNDWRITPPGSNKREVMRRWLQEHIHLGPKRVALRSGLRPKKIVEWMIAYDVVDPKDEKIFKAWVGFKEYRPEEIALLLCHTKRSIQYYLDKYGLSQEKKDITPPGYRRIRKHRPVNKSVLRDPEKLSRLYELVGRRAIAKMVGVSVTRVNYFLDKFDIKTPRTSYEGRKNPCKNREWLEEHYIYEGWSCRRCAEEAGVSPATISNWLVKFGIKPRDYHEAACVSHNPEAARILTCTTGDN
jgi:hypothetical protein